MGTLIEIAKTSTLAGAPQPATVRAPEIEPGVGCDFDSYLLTPDHALDDRIGRAKAQLGRDAVILAHDYHRVYVFKFADFRADSLRLSQQAAATDARFIVFCDSDFMSDIADTLV